jgi:hypothetical protein
VSEITTSMKRGVFLNLKILFVLILLAALPFLMMFGAGLLGSFLGCEMSGASMPDGFCGVLYTILFVVGWSSIAIVPFTVGALLLYLLGILTFFAGSALLAGLKGHAVSPTVKGMGISTLVIIILGGCVAGGVLAVNWYQIQYVGRCEGLPEVASTGKRNGPLAMAVEVPAGSDIEAYTILAVTPDGRLLFQLNKSYRGREPAWSPDGRQLAFAAQDWQTKQSALHLVDLQGNVGPALLTNQTRLERISWLPDATRLLFEGLSEEKSGELYFINADGSERRRLTFSTGLDGDARISPDGRQIVFASYRNGGRDIYLMDSDGSNLRRLTRSFADDINPAWSPDGRWIVFASNRSSNLTMSSVYNLYTMSADGSNQCQLTQGEHSEWEPVWSPDGQWIAYVSWLQGEVYLVRPNGQDFRTLPLPVEVKYVFTLDWAEAK